MRKAILILSIVIAIPILIYLLFLSDPACWALNISQFLSVAAKPSASMLPNDQPVEYFTFHTAVSFRSGQFFQTEDDYFITGPYTCERGIITAHSTTGDVIQGSYDPASGILRWGGKAYRRSIGPQSVPITLTPRPAEPSPPMTMAVAANKDWQKTGLKVRKGQTLIVLYDGGLWTFDRDSLPTDGGGTPGLTVAGAPVPGSNLGSLVAKIGNGPPFPIGNQATLQMDRTGPLFLRINDVGDLTDNEGSLNMKIRIEPAP